MDRNLAANLKGKSSRMSVRNLPALDFNVIFLTLIAHTGFGLYVVLYKYLLDYLPPFALLAAAFGFAVPVTFLIGRRNLDWKKFWMADTWLLSGVVIARSISKVFAVRYTLATYVQLIDLSVPFFTPILAWMLLKERMPSRTLLALAATGLGSFLMITVNPFQVQLPNGKSDIIGVVFALVSSFMMSLGVIFTRRLTTRTQNPVTVFFQMVVVTAIAYSVLSALAHESWQPFASLTLPTGVIYLVFILLSVIGAGLAQILAISRINATLFSTLLSWRLVVAVGVGWILLGERLTTVWQGIGLVAVVASLSMYLQHQAAQHK